MRCCGIRRTSEAEARRRGKARGGKRRRLGFSFAELLVATLIMMLAMALVTQCVSIAYRHFFLQTQRSAAGILLASLESAVQDELAYAYDIEADSDGNVISYHSYRAGNRSSLKVGTLVETLNGERADGAASRTRRVELSETGQVYLEGDANSGNPYGLLPAGVYNVEKGRKWEGRSYALEAGLSIRYSGDQFTVTVRVFSEGTTANPLLESTFTVWTVRE